ncbi:nucleotide-diphosphate-sugar epimerase [Acrocarpospora phusangensis]|uniref:Nucleotide-diphosphate-sugar epimerase n=1 Tax=Acrocarpospora phusangensis TaxID=1070424 RepID=A0A919QE34_9ACTN|nr:NmrA family NAD(P)-binding protein [Acrocarpospora phusangensis]GIH24880.1 nucleotide-diphosphate-sugar epimerase [Acrocarpospora phusangensis]
MAEGTVLVTGAAGGAQGRTGRRVTELLRGRGVPVRAMVRTLDERAEYLRSIGAEVVVGDFHDFPSIRKAVDGVSTVYFAYPVQEGLLDATVNMAVAARDAGVTRLVDMVMLVSTPDAPTPRLRENYLSEQVFEWAGIGAAHVRATVFFENIRAMANATIASGVFMAPFDDDTVIPLVAGADVARVAAGVLTAEHVPAGSSYSVIGQVLTVNEIVATLADGLGRKVRFQDVSDELWAEAARERVNDHAVAHLSKLWATFRTGTADYAEFNGPDTIERVGGRRPYTFAEFVVEERLSFSAAGS